ncbi:hypothetical protein FDH61_gp63 [Arthrobacter phage Preamble]|uniref:Uncharacterized protein n=1 Tax=Arthrobacter phage Preamble TaxID=1772310 RepID=A0A0U4K9D3_9CAUD|nr:hypothetical protein FDH61_gp63 [Arthrobacter phage Preamble]ALY09843.1 hypothetical protein PREAMBLE_63 [Arthrobacter phage Preamble]
MLIPEDRIGFWVLALFVVVMLVVWVHNHWPNR